MNMRHLGLMTAIKFERCRKIKVFNPQTFQTLILKSKLLLLLYVLI